MNHLLDCVVPYTDDPKPTDIDPDLVKVKPKHSLSKLRKTYSFSIRRPKLSWSTTDLSSKYRHALTALPRGPQHQPQEVNSPQMFLDRRKERPSVASRSNKRTISPSLPALSMEETCRKLLEETVIEQQTRKRTLVPRECSIYGELDSPAVAPDISKEPHADYSVCMMSEEERAVSTALKEKWNLDKTRGIHYPSVLKVRRKELSDDLEVAQKVCTGIAPRPVRSTRATAVVAGKCKYCALPEAVIPPGLKASDWLPLIYYRRARRCERQRPSPDGAEKARSVIVNRMLQRNEPHLVVWTCGGKRNPCSEPSPLSGLTARIVPQPSIRNDTDSDTATVTRHNTGVEVVDQDLNILADSASEYSVDTNASSEHSESALGFYRALEVRELQWAKRYRVPMFPPSCRDRHKSITAGIIPEVREPDEVEYPPSTKYDVNKPLPPLPLTTSQRSLRPRNTMCCRGLRRSQSAVTLGMLCNQHAARLQAGSQPRYREDVLTSVNRQKIGLRHGIQL